MSTDAGPQAGRRPRLNPFAFPSDTTFRFVLLVGAVLGTTLYVWNWIYFAVGSNSAAYGRDALECLRLAPPASTNLDDYRTGTSAYTACVQELNKPSAWWMIGGAALVVLLAVALTLARPRWQEHRRKLRPLTEADAPEVVEEVRRLAVEAGLAQMPALAWSPLDSAPTGLAYGHAGRYTVALTGGLVIRHATDPEAFRAVVRHELAHIRNRDVDLTYFAVSLWHAFLLGAVLPFVLTLLDEGPSAILRVSWRLLALAVLVYLTRNAVLRSREVYADVRASVGEGASRAIRRVLSTLPRKPERRWRRLLRVHPDPAVRLAAVTDTRPMFRLELVTAFGAGVTATVAYESVVDVVAAFVNDPLDMRFVAALAFAPAVVGVVGLGVWRSSFATLADGRWPGPVWLLSLALAAGFLIGPELSLEGSIVTEGDTLLSQALDGKGLLWVAGLLAVLTLLLEWVRACASAWIRALAGRRSRAAVTAGLLAAGGVMTIVMGVFYVSRDLRAAIGIAKQATAVDHATISAVTWGMPEWIYQLVMNPQLVWTLQRPLILPALLTVIALPLAAAFVRRARGPVDTSWAFLDAGGRLDPPPLEFHPLRPLLVGLAGGAAFLLAALVLRLGLHSGVDAATRARIEFSFAFYSWQVALAVLAQAAVGAVATAVSLHRARVLDGLAAALITGSIAAIGIFGGPAAAGCVDAVAMNPGPCAWDVSADFAWDVYRQVVLLGAVGALAASLVTLGVVSLAHRHEAGDELRPAGAAR
jgi:Zn-dependent protease with chaperone function